MVSFGIAVKAFIINDNKLLIVKRSPDDIETPNIWEIPGGRLELGEDPYIGLKREIKEETNIDIEILNILNVQYFTRHNDQTITMLIFLCKSLNNDINLSKEHSESEWISLDKCKDKLNKFFHKEVDIFSKLDLIKYT